MVSNQPVLSWGHTFWEAQSLASGLRKGDLSGWGWLERSVEDPPSLVWANLSVIHRAGFLESAWEGIARVCLSHCPFGTCMTDRQPLWVMIRTCVEEWGFGVRPGFQGSTMRFKANYLTSWNLIFLTCDTWGCNSFHTTSKKVAYRLVLRAVA